MKKAIFLTMCAFLMSNLIYAQDTTRISKPQKPSYHKDYISSGFYILIGPVFPVGEYATEKLVPVESNNPATPVVPYLPAKIGGAMDMGFLIYLGPSFAGNRIRAGIDATFLSIWFNSTRPADRQSVTDHYYYYGGQKFGPVITVNPVDKLMIDFSYKLNANLGYHFDEWHNTSDDDFSKYGVTLMQNELSLSIRYMIMKFAIQYNFGDMKYNNFDNSRPNQTIQTNTLRIMVGFKF
jgi:hypothetical protein